MRKKIVLLIMMLILSFGVFSPRVFALPPKDPIEYIETQLGQGDYVTGVSLGWGHSSAWTSDGKVWMWGGDSVGQLGDGGSNTDQNEPVDITDKFSLSSGEKVIGVSLGWGHSSAWSSDGKVWMWGSDEFGQIGDGGTSTDQDQPVDITNKFALSSGEQVIGVSLGWSQSSAWTSDGKVWTWGEGLIGVGGYKYEGEPFDAPDHE